MRAENEPVPIRDATLIHSGEQNPGTDEQNSEYFFGGIFLASRPGKYFTVSSLKQINFMNHIRDPKLLDTAEVMRSAYMLGVELFEKDALSHLCLPFHYQLSLMWSHHIATVSEMRHGFANNTLSFGYGATVYVPGNRHERDLISILATWDAIPDDGTK